MTSRRFITMRAFKHCSWLSRLFKSYTLGSYKKQDLKFKDFSRTFQHLKILFQDHFIFIKSAFNIAMQKWVLRKQDTLWNFAHPIKLFNWNDYGYLQEIIRFAKKGNSRTFKHSYSKSTVFQGFQGLEKVLVKFKHFQALQGPVRTMYTSIKSK